MNRILMFLTLCLSGLFPMTAQEIVSGRVIDSNKEPMPGVRVEIVGRNEFAYTDIDGAFRIEVPVTAKKVRVSYPGFKPKEEKIKPDMVIRIGHGWEGHDHGYRGFFDWNLGFGFGGNASVSVGNMSIDQVRPWAEFGITMSHGYQINRNLYVGIGAGANLMFTHGVERGNYQTGQYDQATGNYVEMIKGYEDHYPEFYGAQFPFFVDVRWDFGLGKRISPFIGLKIGYQVNITAETDYEIYYAEQTESPTYLDMHSHNVNGFFLQPTIGIRRSIGAKKAVNIGLTMNVLALQKFTAESYDYYDNPMTFDLGRNTGSVLMLDLGFDF